MNILIDFVKQYKNEYHSEIIEDENAFIAHIKNINKELLAEKFKASVQLKSILQKQIRKARYPIEIAITGQFSSGKSTFLNALLSKDILPTGITPVTSKVNYINYDKEYKLKITYNSGMQEFAPIDEISKFTDQRKNEIKDIKYLSLYAPLEILKNISFVDTPGLNSQSIEDTNTTRNILRDVGGIIWLTLLDNAGKQSEAEILEEYMDMFKDKSLCVLNQKDKFSNQQIDTTTNYVKNKFSKYFSLVTAISSKQALQSRMKNKEILIADEQNIFIQNIKDNLNNKNYNEFFNNSVKNYEEKLININKSVDINNDKLLKQSNINEVINFIQNNIRPQANIKKEFSIKKDLRNICDILIKEYQTIVEVYNSLSNILIDSQNEILQNFENIKNEYDFELKDIFISFNSILEDVSICIYKNIKIKTDHKYTINKGFLNKDKYNKINYESYYIDTKNIYDELFYNKEHTSIQVKNLSKKFTNTKNNLEYSFKDIFLDIKNRITKWQEPYELIKKHREIASDLEFSTTRHFAAKVYENVTRHFNISILNHTSILKEQISSFNSSLLSSYNTNIKSCINHFEQQLENSIQLHLSNPSKYSIYIPDEEEILNILKSNFEHENKEQFLNSRTNFLYKIIKNSKNNYLEINKSRIDFINEKKNIYTHKINDLEIIKEKI